MTPGAPAAAPSNPVLANGLAIQPAFRADAFASHPEATLGRFGLLGSGMSDGDGYSGLPWFGLQPAAESTGPLGMPPVHGDAPADSDFPLWSPLQQPVLPPPSNVDVFEDVQVEQIFGALALVAALPILTIRGGKEKTERNRQLPGENGRRV